MGKPKEGVLVPLTPEIRRRLVAAEACVEAIVELLYPDGDSNHEWEVSDLDEIAAILAISGFGPHATKKTTTEGR